MGGGGVCQNKQNDGLTVSRIRERKFQQREIDLDQLTDEDGFAADIGFTEWSIKYLVEILKDDLQRQTRRNHTLSPLFRAIFSLEAGAGRKTR